MGLASHPAAEESDRTGKAPHARSDDVQDLAGRGLRAQKKNDRFNNIIEPNELQKSGLFHSRLDRQRSEPPHQRTATKGCAPDNHGRAQDDPIESAGFQRRFTSMFAGRKRLGLRPRNKSACAEFMRRSRPPTTGPTVSVPPPCEAFTN